MKKFKKRYVLGFGCPCFGGDDLFLRDRKADVKRIPMPCDFIDTQYSKRPYYRLILERIDRSKK